MKIDEIKISSDIARVACDALIGKEDLRLKILKHEIERQLSLKATRHAERVLYKEIAKGTTDKDIRDSYYIARDMRKNAEIERADDLRILAERELL